MAYQAMAAEGAGKGDRADSPSCHHLECQTPSPLTPTAMHTLHSETVTDCTCPPQFLTLCHRPNCGRHVQSGRRHSL